ncbi:protein far-red elongated hypocotyl 3 [Quercus suber]|uniref:Protein far-red elongated hypocotyl 3 n=1 Tax=Quercus suber TaxID=58331 RepID=A0AAW0JNQ1_QUESU
MVHGGDGVHDRDRLIIKSPNVADKENTGPNRERKADETMEPDSNIESTMNIPVKRRRGRINLSWSKTDCKACMHVKTRQDGLWIISSFIKDHNHEIFPDQAYYFRGHRNLDLGSSNVDALHAIRARTKKMFATMSRQSGGYKKLGDEGSLSQETYNIALNALEEALRKCESVNNSIQSLIEPSLPSTHGPQGLEEVNQVNSTSNTNRKNSASKKRQVQPEPEVLSIGTHDSWPQMGHANLRAPALDCSYESQERMQGMEQLQSRAAALDGYFSTQQLVQGMGQLNSIAPIHDVHYLARQRLHEMGQLHFRPQTIPSCFDVQDSLQDMDQSNMGPSQLHGMASKHIHQKHLSR